MVISWLNCLSLNHLLLTLSSIILCRILYVDFTTRRIPDYLTGVLGVIGGIYHTQLLTAILLSGGFYILKKVYRCLRSIDGLGWGDIKLVFALGLWLPVDAIPAFLILSGIGGIIFGYLYHGNYSNKPFPFAPSLIISFTCVYLLKIANSN